MKNLKLFVCVTALLLCSNAFAQKLPLFTASDFTPEQEFTVNCEGPSVDYKGTVYAVNIDHDGTVAKISPKGKTSLFVELPEGSTGNGIRFGSKNDMYIADFKGHNILLLNRKTKKVSVFCHEPEMDQPNDLAFSTKYHIYASDPNWNENTGRIWHINAKGEASIVADNMGTTNGIEVSPDEKTLYVNESNQRKVWAFDIQEDGSLENKRLLISFTDHGMDGMRCDSKGNLYVTRWGKGEVVVVSPEGEILHTVKMKGKKTSNIAFGGKDGKTCYVTLQDRKCLETFRTDTPGREWKMMQAWK